MTSQQQSDLLTDLAPACETGEADAIKDVMDTHFHQLQSARSLFCVEDEHYEKPSLPESRDFLNKGYLHSFLASRRLMLMKNLGEGEDFRFTNVIGLDTQFPSFLRSRYQGVSNSDRDEALTECLQYLAPYRSGMGMEPYFFENSQRLDDPKVRETVEAYVQFLNTPEDSLITGEIGSTLTGAELARNVDGIMSMVRGADWQAYASHGRIYWAVAYITLLIAAAIHLTSGRRSPEYRLGRFLEELDKLFVFPKIEIHLVHAFFERGNQERFFRQIQANGSDFTDKLKNMAWDLSYSRTILQNVSTLARSNPDNADFVAPYFLTFDQPLRELLSGFQANGLITYIDEGVKNIIIYPLEIESTLTQGYQGSKHLFTPERAEARKERGKEFFANESRREDSIKHAEDLLDAVISQRA